MHESQSLAVRLRPDRLEVRVVDGVVDRQPQLHGDGPRRVGPAPHLGDRALDVAGGRLQVGGEAPRVAGAYLVEVGVKRAHERQVDVRFLVAAERVAHQVLLVDALLHHLLDALVDEVVLDADSRVDAAHELLEAALLALPGARLAEMPGLALSPALLVPAEPVPVAVRLRELLSRASGLHRPLELLELRQPRLVGGLQVLADSLRRGLKVRVHVPDPVAASHSAPPRAALLSAPALSWRHDTPFSSGPAGRAKLDESRAERDSAAIRNGHGGAHD